MQVVDTDSMITHAIRETPRIVSIARFIFFEALAISAPETKSINPHTLPIHVAAHCVRLPYSRCAFFGRLSGSSSRLMHSLHRGSRGIITMPCPHDVAFVRRFNPDLPERTVGDKILRAIAQSILKAQFFGNVAEVRVQIFEL